MRDHSIRLLCRCGCGTPAHRDSGFPRGKHVCTGTENRRYWARVDQAAGACWLWTGVNKAAGSYGRFLTDMKAWVRAHRYAWTVATSAPVPEGFDVLHTCDNPPCVRNDERGWYEVNGVVRPRWGHLWLGTHDDNMADKNAKGRVYHPPVTRSPRDPIIIAKLSDDDVREVRRLLAIGHSHRAIAARFSVAHPAIGNIARGKAYKHVL
jgi:hypothetical protein